MQIFGARCLKILHFHRLKNGKNYSSPLILKADKYVRDQCNIYIDPDNVDMNNATKILHENGTFDTSTYSNTVIMDMNLICDRSSLASFSQSIFFLGYLLGVICAGFLADFFRPKKDTFAFCLWNGSFWHSFGLRYFDRGLYDLKIFPRFLQHRRICCGIRLGHGNRRRKNGIHC